MKKINLILFEKLTAPIVKETIKSYSDDYRNSYTDLCNKLNCITDDSEDELNKLLKDNPKYIRILKDMDLWGARGPQIHS